MKKMASSDLISLLKSFFYLGVLYKFEGLPFQFIILKNVSSMKTKNYYTVILRSDSDEESFEDSSLRSE